MKDLISQYYRLILHSEAQKFTLAVKQGNEVKYPHQQNYLSEADLIQAIEGEKTIGIMLSQDKTYLTKAGAIDIDIPRDAKNLSEGLALAQRCSETALKLNLRGFIEFSGSRGYHLWIFANKPIYASLMQNCLKAITEGGRLRLIASQANFEVKEIFPNSIPESKCIKLPATIHLKSDRRCGFIDENFNPNNPQINLESQAKLMAEFEQNSLETLTAVANLTLENSSNNSQPETNQKEINQKLNSFGNNHPSCINHLINNGSPLEIDYNQANLTLVRYSLSRNMELEEAIALAELMAKNTSDNHPTSKDYQGKISNFKSAFNSCDRNREIYQFSCSYVLANLNGQKLATRGCIGSKCSLFKPKTDYQTNSSTQNNFSGNHFSNHSSDSNSNQNNFSAPEYYPLNRFIFEAMIKLFSEDKECCKSLILLEVENQISDFEAIPKSDNLPDSIRLIETEVLSYLLKNPDLLLDCLDIQPQGFTVTTTQSLPEYFDYLLILELPSEETLEAHLNLIREKGVKQKAIAQFNQYQNQLKSSESLSVEVISKSISESEILLNQSLNDQQLLSVSDNLSDIISDLLNEDKISIPTFSSDLNDLFNGGFAQSRLTVIGAPPANGKSTFCVQIADLASSLGFRVVYASYEMSREQIFITQLSRLGLINSSLLEGKKYLKDEQLKTKFFELIAEYRQKIAPNMHIIEADDLYTPNRLLAVVKKLKANLLIIDYLQLLSSGDKKLDNAYNETLRVSKIATELKRLSRRANIPIIAISDVNKNAYNEAQKGGDLDMSALRDSFKIAHSADVIMLLISNNFVKNIKDFDGNKTEQTVTQLFILAEKFRDFNPEISRKIEGLAHEYRLDKARADTYSRLIIAKNRTGKCGEVLFRYSKALHYFEPMNYLTNNLTNNEVF